MRAILIVIICSLPFQWNLIDSKTSSTCNWSRGINQSFLHLSVITSTSNRVTREVKNLFLWYGSCITAIILPSLLCRGSSIGACVGVFRRNNSKKLDEAIHLDLSGMLFFNSIVKGNANRLKGGRSARHACNRKVEFNKNHCLWKKDGCVPRLKGRKTRWINAVKWQTQYLLCQQLEGVEEASSTATTLKVEAIKQLQSCDNTKKLTCSSKKEVKKLGIIDFHYQKLVSSPQSENIIQWEWNSEK